jgi:anti-anti-sigma factor
MIESPAASSPPVVSAPTGVLDQPAADALIEAIKVHIGNNEVHHIIDLRGIDKVGARTIRTIITIHRKIVEIGGSVRLVIDDPKALRYVKLTALSRVFGVYATNELAIAGYESDDRDASRSEADRTKA